MDFVDKVVRAGHMKTETAEFIKSKLKDTSPEPYYASTNLMRSHMICQQGFLQGG